MEMLALDDQQRLSFPSDYALNCQAGRLELILVQFEAQWTLRGRWVVLQSVKEAITAGQLMC